MPSQKPVFLVPVCSVLNVQRQNVEAQQWLTVWGGILQSAWVRHLCEFDFCFSSHLICSPLVLKSCRRRDSRPTWISTILVTMLNLEPSFSHINHIFRRQNCSSTSAVEKGVWGKLPVGFLSRAEESPPWCRAGAVWGVPA